MSIIEEDVVTVKVEENIALLKVNRPKALNALNPDVLVSLLQYFGTLAKDQNLRAVIITGEGEKAFVAGADVQSMAHLGPRAISDYVELGQRTMRVIESFRVPVIAAVNGYALGGGMELALACDLIVASERAQFGQPEVKLGIMPGFGGTQRLILRSGVAVARRLCYMGEFLDAQEALRVGIIDRVVDHPFVVSEAFNMARSIAIQAPLAIQGVKKVIRQATDTQLLAGLRMEVEEFLRLFATVDREEGMQAFLQKRDPKFHGR